MHNIGICLSCALQSVNYWASEKCRHDDIIKLSYTFLSSRSEEQLAYKKSCLGNFGNQSINQSLACVTLEKQTGEIKDQLINSSSSSKVKVQQFASKPRRYGNSRAIWDQCYLPPSRIDIPVTSRSRITTTLFNTNTARTNLNIFYYSYNSVQTYQLPVHTVAYTATNIFSWHLSQIFNKT